MGKQSRNANRGRGNAPARPPAGGTEGREPEGETATQTQPAAPSDSGMNQEMPGKRKKRFGHN